MKNFKDYLKESAIDHVYIIKFAQEPTAEQVAVIQEWLKRYDLKNSSQPALIENDTYDFIDIPNRKVFKMNITLGTPISSYILLQDLKTAANINEKLMVVRGQSEPVEVEAQYQIWNKLQDANAASDGLVSTARLSTDREYSADEQPVTGDLFGDNYNRQLLSYLAGVASDRPTMNKEPAAPLFSWLQLEDVTPGEPHQDTSDFNAHIDTPKPTTKGSTEKPAAQKYINSHNEMGDSAIPKVKFFKDPKTGNAKTVVQPVEKE